MKFIVSCDAVFTCVQIGTMKQVIIGHKEHTADIESSGFDIIGEREATNLIASGHQVVLMPGSALLTIGVADPNAMH